MKRKRIFFAVFVWSLVWAVSAQTMVKESPEQGVYTIISNPGENAGKEIRINWHTDPGNEKNYCVYTEAVDTKWKKAKKVKARQEMCTVFDSLYSKDSQGKDFYENARFLRCEAELKQLKPGTAYMYRVGTKKGMSEIRYFRTAPESGVWSAGIISDFHAYSPLPGRVEAAMGMIKTLEGCNGKDFDFMLHVGDICAWGGSYSFWKRLYSEPYFSKYMWAGVNGNHDNMDRKSVRLSNQYFRCVNNNPENGYAGQEGVCYHFTYGNALFIILNNESMRSDEGFAAAQQWVEQVIRAHSAKYIIVMEHYQWFFGESGKTSQYARWKELFDRCGVDLAIGANNHIYARTNALYQDRETDGTRGTVYIQTPSSDNERGQELKAWTDNTGLIKYRWSEGGRTVGAIIMKATQEKLQLTLYDRNGNEIDSVSVRAKR